MNEDLILYANGAVVAVEPDTGLNLDFRVDAPLIVEEPRFVAEGDAYDFRDNDDRDAIDDPVALTASERLAHVLVDAAAELDGELDVPPARNNDDLTPLLWEAAGALDEGEW